MTKLQAIMWDSMRDVVYGDNLYDGLLGQCQTPRYTNGHDLCREMSKKFKATLDEKQQKAFYYLENLLELFQWEDRERNIAMGLQLSNEIRTLLDHPMEAYRQASATNAFWRDIAHSEIEALENYFKEYTPPKGQA